MKTDLAVIARRCRRLALAFGLTLAAVGQAQAQLAPPPPPSGVSYAPPAADEPQAAPEAAPAARRSRATIRPYLEVAQVVSAELDGGETLTYSTVAAGIDGSLQTRRVSVSASYRYQRAIEWSGDVGDQDQHSGVAAVSAQIVPGVLQFDAGALATRTGGEGRAFGVTDRDASVEVYSAYAGPSLSTHAGPVAITASYRLGYVAVDDDTPGGPDVDDYDDSVAHMATASVGMAPGRLPIGWTVGAGYARSDSGGDFDDRLEAAYVRGDVVVPVSPTLAFTAGVGYEDIEASQRDIARDANGVPILDANGQLVADPSRPRLLAYDVSGLIYDAGLIWRPTARTELQVRAGHRYGGTTVVGSLSHQFNADYGVTATVFDSVETSGSQIVNNISRLPDNFEANRNPLTGGLGGCVFGADAGSGLCLDDSLQSIRSGSFRARGASLVFSGSRRLWSFGAGAGYTYRRFGRPDDAAFDAFAGKDESFSLFGSVGRQLSRSSEIDFSAYASWFDTDEAGFDTVFSTGADVSYSRRLLMDRLQFLAAFGLSHADDGTDDQSVASGLLGLRYTF